MRDGVPFIAQTVHSDRLKVASRDLTNLPLLAAMAETRIPIVLSTGMAGKKELDDALDVITRYHSDISILHCVSQYPTQPDNLNLRTISYLKNITGSIRSGSRIIRSASRLRSWLWEWEPKSSRNTSRSTGV